MHLNHEYLHLTRLASYPFVLASYRKNREVTLHFLYTVTDEIQWNICVLCAYITTIIPNLSGGAREADFPKGVNRFWLVAFWEEKAVIE